MQTINQSLSIATVNLSVRRAFDLNSINMFGRLHKMYRRSRKNGYLRTPFVTAQVSSWWLRVSM